MTVALLLPLIARAGGWHRGESLVCSDCHTMHGSQGHAWGSSAAVTAEPKVGGDWLAVTVLEGKLLKESRDQLCLACHDGKSFAPDVAGEAGYAADRPGGAFQASGGASILGHDLDSSARPPDGPTTVTLACGTCHEPHGNSSFRNLRANPSGTSSDVAVQADDAVSPDGGNAAAVYATGNVSYRAGMSDWCRSCHSQYDPGTSHPVDRVLYGSWMVDFAAWQAIAPADRVRVENDRAPGFPDRERYDEVFCLSCHRAHGSPFPDALIRADGLSLDSTCNQCHDK